MYQMYFDGSGKPPSPLITLASCVGQEKDMEALGNIWRGALSDGYMPDFLHMADAVTGRGDYDGWGLQRVGDRIGRLLNALVGLHASSIRCFVIALDVGAFNNWRTRIGIWSKPERVCAQWAFYRAIAKLREEDGEMAPGAIAAVFDRNEGYLKHVRSDFDSRRRIADWRSPLINCVRSIEMGDMKTSPAIQVADMFAWSTNRLLTSPRVGAENVNAWAEDLLLVPKDLDYRDTIAWNISYPHRIRKTVVRIDEQEMRRHPEVLLD